MSESVESVKYVIRDLRTWANNNREDSRTSVADRMDKLVEKLKVVESDLVRLHGLTSALPPDLGNIHDLPSELLGELNVTKTDELDDQLVTIINSYDGEASLDQILVGLYRKFQVIQKRRFVQNKLYRMEMIWSVDGRKGVYTTTEPEERLEINEFEDMAEAEIAEDLDSEVPF